MNAQFNATQQLLLADHAGPKNWKLVSISIDPARDTPEVLATFSKALNAHPDHWFFATGDLKDITAFTLKSGFKFWDEQGQLQHNLRTLVINPDGTVREILVDGEWKPEDLAGSIRTAALQTHQP